MTYVLPLQTMKINFSGPKIHSTAEESEGYTAGSASRPVFTLEPTLNLLFGAPLMNRKTSQIPGAIVPTAATLLAS